MNNFYEYYKMYYKNVKFILQNIIFIRYVQRIDSNMNKSKQTTIKDI